MKKIVLIIVLIIIIFLIDDSFSASIIPNWDFEEINEKGVPLFWEISGINAGVKISLDKEFKRSGKNSLKIEIKKQVKLAIKSKEFNLEGGKKYRITLWCRTNNFTGKIKETNSFFTIWGKDKEGKTIRILTSNITSNEIPWRFIDFIFDIPENINIGYISLHINVSKEDHFCCIWFDRIKLNPFFSLPVPENPEIFDYTPVKFAISGGSKIIDDRNSLSKKAVYRSKKEKRSVLHYGPYQTDQKSGQYKVIFRLKVSDNTIDKPVAKIVVGTNYTLNSYLVSKEIKGTDFKKPNTWQEFELEFIRPPSGWISTAVYFLGGVDLYSESYSIVEERIFKTDKEIMEFY